MLNDEEYRALIARRAEATAARDRVEARVDSAREAQANALRVIQLQEREAARRGDISGVNRDTHEEDEALAQAERILAKAEDHVREAEGALVAFLNRPENVRARAAEEARGRVRVIRTLIGHVDEAARIIGPGDGLARVLVNGRLAEGVLTDHHGAVLRETLRAAERDLAEYTTGLRHVGYLVQDRPDLYAHRYIAVDDNDDALTDTYVYTGDPTHSRPESVFPIVAAQRRDLFLGSRVETPRDWGNVDATYELFAANDAGVSRSR